MNLKNRKMRSQDAGSGSAVAEATPETPQNPFVDGKRTVTIVDKEFKPRGKGNAKDAPAVKATVSYTEIDNLSVLTETLLAATGNDSAKAIEAANGLFERLASSAVYDTLFGDEIKIRGLAKSLMAVGLPEDAAFAQARKIFAESTGKSE